MLSILELMSNLKHLVTVNKFFFENDFHQQIILKGFHQQNDDRSDEKIFDKEKLQLYF